MQFTTEVLHSKPPSLEEGPMGQPEHNENCVFYRVEKRGLLQKCMEIIKLILLLEVIFFVGWLGSILIANYHLQDNRDITGNDAFLNNFHGQDFPVTPNSIPDDSLASTSESGDAISSTEHSQITTITGTVVSNIEESYGDNEWPWFNRDVLDKDSEWPWEIYHQKNILSNPPIDNAAVDVFEKNTESQEAEADLPKVRITDNLEIPSLLFPNSGLIHVIEDRVDDSDIESDRKTGVPFPLLKILSGKETGDEEKNKLEDDTTIGTIRSESVLPVGSIFDLDWSD